MRNSIMVQGVKIAGIAACVPSTEIDNLESGRELYGQEIESIVKMIGVEKRRVCPERKVTSLDLSIRAAEEILECFEKEKFGAVICVTQTPDNLLPNNSTLAQSALGFPTSVAAFDINLACSGYIYGLYVAALVSGSMQKPVLLLDGDTHSHFVSASDRSTALLFGDAGTATVITPDMDASPWCFDFETDGNQREALIIPAGGYRNRFAADSMSLKQYPDGNKRRDIDMKMDGMAVFNFVVKKAPESLREMMSHLEKTPRDFDALVLHQANRFMIRQVAKGVGFKPEQVPLSLHKYGNSSSATIPVTVASELREKIVCESQKILMCGFGAGLSLGTASLEIGPCLCPEVIEYEC